MKKSVFFVIALLCAAASAQEQAPPAGPAGQEAPNAATVQEAPNVKPDRLFNIGATQAPPSAGAVQTPPPAGATPAPPPIGAVQTPPPAGAIQTPPAVGAQAQPAADIQAAPEPEPAPAAEQALPEPEPPPAPPPPVEQAATPAQPAPEPAAPKLPRIAVYVTGSVGEGEKAALGTRMLTSLVNSKRYRGIERSNSFLAEIEKEQEKQRSGDIDDSQISALGKQFGVTFVCIADITPALGAFHVSARIINVETAEVEFIGDASTPLKTLNDLAKVSEMVVKKMFDEAQTDMIVPDFTAGERWATWALNVVPGLGSGIVMKDTKGAITNAVLGGLGWTLILFSGGYGGPAVAGTMALGVSSAWNIYRSAAYRRPNAERRPWKNRMSYGAGGFFESHLGGGVEWSGGDGEVAMPYYGGGGYAYFDLIYAEIFAGISGGGGKWQSNNVSNQDDLPNMQRAYMNYSLLLKWPFGWERVKIFPLAGFEYEQSISAKLSGNDKITITPSNGGLSAMWFKFGGGVDVALNKRAYVRAEALYGSRMYGYSYEYQWDNKVREYGNSWNTYYRSDDGLTLKAGFGMKIGKVQ